MFAPDAEQSEVPRLVSPRECLVRPGVIQRAWLADLAVELSALETAGEWGTGIDELWYINVGIERVTSAGTMFVSVNTAVDSNGAANEPPEIAGEMTPPENREELALRCEEAGFRSIQWLVAALDAPEGALAEGETNDRVIARLALRALADLTSSYAFGNFEKVIVRDALWGSDVRERLDRIALRVLDLPELGWWSEEFAPTNFGYHLPADPEGSRPVEARAGEKLPADAVRERAPRRFSKERRAFDAELKAIEKNLIGLPRIMGTSWDAPSQSAIALAQSFRTTDPRWLAGSDLDASNFENCVCTEQFLGDDAGDRPIGALSRTTLAGTRPHVATIHSGQDWVDLILKYPMVIVSTDGSVYQEEWGGTAGGTWVTLDWRKLADDLDGVYVSVLGALDAAYVPQAVSLEGQELWTMITGWVPSSVLWAKSPL
ncbi:MAG: hypothetical protein ACTHW1_11745 [Ancrocorticia sp.]|uniref:hypothetical protein n=1 Tax=Ancrocorticia sp. TaxID=2593684 RepID=UPI003F9391A3